MPYYPPATPAIPTPVSIANGGTGSATQNFVDLTTAQATIAGNKTFTGNTTTTNLTNNTLLTANTEADVVGSSGTFHITAASDGGDYNMFSSSGNQTLALYGSGGNTLNLHLLDGIASFDGGTNTGSGASITSPSFVTGTALQVNATKDSTLYIDVTVAGAYSIAIGSTSSTTTTLQSSVLNGLGLTSIRVPAAWYIKITGTIANLSITAITC